MLCTLPLFLGISSFLGVFDLRPDNLKIIELPYKITIDAAGIAVCNPDPNPRKIEIGIAITSDPFPLVRR